MEQPTNSTPPNGVYVDTKATYQYTFLALGIGVILAIMAGLALYTLRGSFLTSQVSTMVTVGRVMTPIAAIVTIAILMWSIFSLPVRFARRQGLALDPDVWPWTGAVGAGLIVIALFILAMIVGVI